MIDTVGYAEKTPDEPQPYAELGLAVDEYARIREILKRRPTAAELAVYSVMWSEHCSYKSSKVHLRQFGEKQPPGDRLLVGIGENAGVVDAGDGWAVTFKVESHNHPSYVEPYQGAATGVGGIVRDEAALAVLDRDRDLGMLVVRHGPRRRGRLDPQPLVAADEPADVVADQRAGQQVRLAEDLEAVADAEHGETARRPLDDRLHDRGEAGDRAAAQVVPVREAAGEHDGVCLVQVRIGMPERHRLGAGSGDRAGRVTVVQTAGKGHDADPHCHGRHRTGRGGVGRLRGPGPSRRARRWCAGRLALAVLSSTLSATGTKAIPAGCGTIGG